ncbi:hypothetical protein REPUB_Repub09cG0034000 [Reevesia pubescens]
MITHRCGIPDIVRNRTSKDTKEAHGHNHGIFHLVANYSFFPGSPGWTRYQLTYNFLPNSLQVVNFQLLRNVITRAFQTWAVVSPFSSCFSPQDGRFHYDADENWSSNPAPNQMDLESVAVHEIGHNLGLDHSWDQYAVMYPTIQLGTTKRNLGQDDINGLQALYGYYYQDLASVRPMQVC